MSRVPKVLIAAAGVTGAAAYGLPQPWSLVAVVVDLLLIGLAGGLWSRAGRGPRWRIEGADAGRGSTATSGYPQPGPSHGPGELPLPAARRRRGRPPWASSAVGGTASATSRVRRQSKGQPSASPGVADDPVDVHDGLARLETLMRATNERGQRTQLWFFFAGVAVSIPAGIVVNLLTG
ncbi:hypothetical protein ACLQ22_02060 [Micromonospora sp. DT178]|uniref:hypothetical protein n=1 Tax=Micromonospora sp. DT178 TaxID=3393436 RepID=UPI003CF28BCC